MRYLFTGTDAYRMMLTHLRFLAVPQNDGGNVAQLEAQSLELA